MKHKYLIFFILLFISSCAKDDSANTSCEADINTPTGNEPDRISTGKTLDQGSLFNECVSTENITSTITDFIRLYKGSQEEGIAKGIKINEEWEASIILYHYDSSFSIFMITFWDDSPNSFITGEVISLANIPINNPVGCYNLTSEISTSDSVHCGYRVDEYDINLLRYTLDESKENKLEILEYDNATGILKAKMKASFITDEAAAPDFPEKVRFFNVDIETY
ncbi:MAG: hypothetical protein ACI8RY_001781 [Urechidicola sp.]|jgi:hypothetical protein